MMKKLLLVLMIVTLMAGMSLTAMATETKIGTLCEDGSYEHDFDVILTILPYAQVEVGNDFLFGELGFCEWQPGGKPFRLFWINGGAFLQYAGGAREAVLPGHTDKYWNDKSLVEEDHIGGGGEINPSLIITTNARVDATFKFVGQDEEGVNWPAELPTLFAIWKFNNPDGTGGGAFVSGSNFGQKVDLRSGAITDTAILEIPAATSTQYHLDAGILFDAQDFWKYPAADYTGKIQVTVAYPTAS